MFPFAPEKEKSWLLAASYRILFFEDLCTILSTQILYHMNFLTVIQVGAIGYQKYWCPCPKIQNDPFL